jgi:hypothetical protein
VGGLLCVLLDCTSAELFTQYRFLAVLLLAAFLKQIHDVHNMYDLFPQCNPITTNQFSSAFHSYSVATHRLSALDSLVQGVPPQQQQQHQQGQPAEGQQPEHQQGQQGPAAEPGQQQGEVQEQQQHLPPADFFNDCPVCSQQGEA